MKYTLSVNMDEHEISNRDELLSLLSKIPEICDLNLERLSGEKQGLKDQLKKLLGTPSSELFSFVGFLRNGDKASVYFCDESGDEWIGYEQTSSFEGGADVEFRYANGRSCFQKASQCVPLSVAVRAVEHFYETARKANWLTWQKSE